VGGESEAQARLVRVVGAGTEQLGRLEEAGVPFASAAPREIERFGYPKASIFRMSVTF
jgi:hypothetical protein